MKKTISVLTLLYLVTAFHFVGYAQETEEERTRQIEVSLKAETGVDYSVSVRSFNKSSEDPKRGLLQDPFGTLKGTHLFEAALVNTTEIRPHGIIGIYKNGDIQWYSKPLYTGIEVGFGSIYRSMDMNNDNKVELFVSWTIPIDGRFGPQYGWIFSWDGSKGNNITETDQDGISVIETHEAGEFYFVDVDGDGILEIYTDRAISSEEPVEYERLFYSWNGQKYGVWPDTPQPDPSTFYPRDKLNISVKNSVTKKEGALHYQYILKNKENSEQGINEFYLSSQTKKSVIKHTSKHGWRFSDRNRTPFFFWSDWGMEPDEILPGETDSSFSYSTKVLPFISRYYIQGANETPTDVSFEEIVGDIRTNSISGYTLGPADPPDPFDASVFTDSLSSYTTQACKLKWITNRGICNSLEKKLQNVNRQLRRGDNKTAANNVQAFINEVEAARRNHLTSEGYGLLYFNAEYLLKQLQEDTNGGQ